MNKKALIILFSIFLVTNPVKASNDELGEIYLKGGYSELNSAIKEAEKFLGQEIILPTRIAPIAFTHCFGRFTNVGSPKLEITFLDEKAGKTHYKVIVIPSEDKQVFKNKKKIEKIELEDGTKGIYYNSDNFNILTMEKNGLQYMFMVDELNSKVVTKEVLLSIANSIK